MISVLLVTYTPIGDDISITGNLHMFPLISLSDIVSFKGLTQ